MSQRRPFDIDPGRIGKQALLTMVLLAPLDKHPALAQNSLEERQLSNATPSLSDSPGTALQGTRKGAPLFGCFSTQDAVAALLSGGQQLPPIPPEFQNTETTVTIRADSQQKIGDTYKLKGHVLINYRDMEVRADDATYDHTSGETVAEGHVTFSDPRSHLEADEAHYNFVTEKGWFANARGFVRSSTVPRRNVMVTQSPFYLSAERLEALAENTYR